MLLKDEGVIEICLPIFLDPRISLPPLPHTHTCMFWSKALPLQFPNLELVYRLAVTPVRPPPQVDKRLTTLLRVSAYTFPTKLTFLPNKCNNL